MNNLALTLQQQGGLLAARTLQEKVLEIRRLVLGDGHADTKASRDNLAVILREQSESN